MFRSLFLLALVISFAAAGQTQEKFNSLDVFELEWASDPQISPDGSQIVYRRNGMDIMKDRKMGSLWIINADGSNHRKLTSEDKSERSPRWSPDGQKIAYVSSTDQGAEIFIYWIKAGQYARLTHLERSPGNLTWSPDGKSLAFTMLVPSRPPYLTKSPKKPKGAKWAESPRVTTRLKHEADGAGYIEQGFQHIFVLSADGGTPRQITSGDFHHRSMLTWAGNGQILFSANRNEDWNTNSGTRKFTPSVY